MHRSFLLGLVLVLTITSCTPDPASSIENSTSEAPASTTLFREGTRESGLAFGHQNGMSGAFYFPEIMGAGGALFDADNDGDLDLYLVQGNPLTPEGVDPLHSDRLLRNDLAQREEGAAVSWVDITENAGLNATGYGMGVAVGDVDNDGWQDLYLLNFGPNQLWRNNGDGTFSDITEASGAQDERWSVSGAFADIDRDGDLDLLVVNYVDFTLASHKDCVRQYRDYCSPQTYRPVPDRLFRNDGGGRFTDITAESGIANAYGAGLGIVTGDFDGNGWVDLYVANDGMANQLWLNQNGRFEDHALISGAALNAMGAAEASMGIDAGDFDGDGDEDLFMTHLKNETNTLYVNDGNGLFEDRTITAALESPSQAYTGFGTAWVDLDNDGWLDLVVVNGDVAIIEAQKLAGSDFPYAQTNQVFLNTRNRFQEVSSQSGLAHEEVSRGLLAGDVDNDGDTDLVITNNNGPARFYLNRQGSQAEWIGLIPRNAQGPALEAQVVVSTSSGRTFYRRSRVSGSYGSSLDPRVLVGLGPEPGSVSATVRWPDGSAEAFGPLPSKGYHQLLKGQGQVREALTPPPSKTEEPREITSKPLSERETSIEPANQPIATAVAIPKPDFTILDQDVRSKLEARLAALGPEADGDAYGEAGMDFHAHQFLETAEACYQHAYLAQPQDMRWAYLLGVVRRSLGDSPGAMPAFARAVALEPGHVPSLLALADHALAQEQADRAGELYKQAMAQGPVSPALMGLGRIALTRGAYQDATQHLKSALRMDPGATTAHYPLALAYRNLGEEAKAREHLVLRGEGKPGLVTPLLTQISARNTSALAYRQQAEQAAAQRRFPQARALFAQALQRAPGDHALRLNLGEIDRLLGQSQQALDSFQQVLTATDASSGQKALAHRYVGEINGELGQNEVAIAHLETALAIDPSQLAAQFHLADALRRAGRFQTAADRYEQVIQQVPNNPASRFGRVFSLIGAGHFQAALERVEEDTRIVPNNPIFRHMLARLLVTVPDAASRDAGRAQALLESLGYNFMDSALAATHAMVAAETGDFAAAISHQEKAIQMAQNEPLEVTTFLQAQLARYRQQQPCRQPWPPDHPLLLRHSFR